MKATYKIGIADELMGWESVLTEITAINPKTNNRENAVLQHTIDAEDGHDTDCYDKIYFAAMPKSQEEANLLDTHDNYIIDEPPYHTIDEFAIEEM